MLGWLKFVWLWILPSVLFSQFTLASRKLFVRYNFVLCTVALLGYFLLSILEFIISMQKSEKTEDIQKDAEPHWEIAESDFGMIVLDDNNAITSVNDYAVLRQIGQGEMSKKLHINLILMYRFIWKSFLYRTYCGRNALSEVCP